MKCSNCGKRISKKYKLCPICGTKVEFVKKDNLKINKKFVFIVGGILFLLLLLFVFNFISDNSKANFDELKKSVVLINVYDSDNELISTGSGVVAFENDIILTNAHVIEDNYKIEVISENNTKYQVDGVLDYNKKKDIAILKLTSSKGLKKVKIGRKVKVGSDVTAIGSPLGLKNTISTGIISAMFQDNIEVYQHTAPISPGSSGGALFNSKGELIGITYASLTAGQNLNLAIPINFFEKDYNKVKNNDVIETQYYYLLNSSIIRQSNSDKLLNYILNDKYDNLSSREVKHIDEMLYNGDIDFNNSEHSLLMYSDIEKYIKASVSLSSGITNYIQLTANGIIPHVDGNYYKIAIFKLVSNKKEISDKIKSSLIKIVEEEWYPGQYEIKCINDYIYIVDCKGYDDCDTVKKLVENIVNQ